MKSKDYSVQTLEELKVEKYKNKVYEQKAVMKSVNEMNKEALKHQQEENGYTDLDSINIR